jgi:hypothetical protein
MVDGKQDTFFAVWDSISYFTRCHVYRSRQTIIFINPYTETLLAHFPVVNSTNTLKNYRSGKCSCGTKSPSFYCNLILRKYEYCKWKHWEGHLEDCHNRLRGLIYWFLLVWKSLHSPLTTTSCIMTSTAFLCFTVAPSLQTLQVTMSVILYLCT